MTAFDVAIVGSGMAAWAFAVSACRAGLSCTVVTGSRRYRSIGEYLPPEGVAAMAVLGLDGLLANPAHRRSPGIVSLWGTGIPQSRDVLLQPGGRAYCLDRAVFEDDLRATAIAAGAVELQGSTLREVSGMAGDWGLDAAVPLRAGFLVDATGRSASIARALGARVTKTDTLTALALYCEGAPVTDAALRVEALADGWCYAAPLSGDRLVAVFLTEAGLLPDGSGARRRLVEERLRHSMLVGPLLSPTLDKGEFRGLAAGSQKTVPASGPGWAAIGDAAMAFDPLASAGITKALLDVREVLETFNSGREALATRRDLRFAGYQSALIAAYAAQARLAGPFWDARRSG